MTDPQYAHAKEVPHPDGTSPEWIHAMTSPGLFPSIDSNVLIPSKERNVSFAYTICLFSSITAPIPVIAPKISMKNFCEPISSYSFKISSEVFLVAVAKCVSSSINKDIFLTLKLFDAFAKLWVTIF